MNEEMLEVISDPGSVFDTIFFDTGWSQGGFFV